jgi:hypothetical protein
MRLWSLHPRYLDAQGLVALWREALLAKAVLQGKTRGYRHHPQLARFRERHDPVAALNSYLRGIHDEALRRGYRFDVKKLGRSRARARMAVSRGQIGYEWDHLMRKLFRRDRARHRALRATRTPSPHPLFRVVQGPVAEWERR